jgi:two-component system CheB/CheR fusion protein
MFSRYAVDIVHTVRQPLVLLDAELRVRAANPAFYRTFRLDAEAVAGQTIFSLRPGESDHSALRTLLSEALPRAGVMEDYEIDGYFPSLGGRRVFVLNGRRLSPQDDGDRVSLLAIEDVTAQRLAAEAAASHTRMLGRRNVELRRSNDALAQFANVASHDLQEPLRKVRMYGEMVRQRVVHKLDDEERVLLDQAIAAAARAQRLIADVLALARVSSREPTWTTIDLTEIVRGVVSDLEVQIRDREARVNIEELPRIDADAVALRQLFQNLISNALKFTRPGTAPEVQIFATQARLDDALAYEIIVRDNGIGFDERHAASIFEPFRRLHPRGVFDGTGMGLAICQKVAEHHGGSIAARSRLGQGSEFIITLPARQHPSESPA